MSIWGTQKSGSLWATKNSQTPSPDWGAVTVKPGAASIATVKASIARQENGQYNKRNPDSGAMGKYQIMPFHLPSLGIKNDTAGIQQFLGSPKLQEQLFNKIVDDLYVKYKDPAKVAAAYYGGGGGAAKYGTKAGDVPQGKYPSINQYVQQVLGRVAGESSQQPFSQNKFQDNNAGAEAIVKGVAQGFLRGSAAGGAAIAGLPRQVKSTIWGGDTSVGKMKIEPEDTFVGQLQRNLYGTDKPISLQSEGEDLPFVKEGSAIAPVLGAAMSLLDLTGAGGTARNFAKFAAGSKSAEEIAAYAVKYLKVKPGVATEMGARYASIKDAKMIEGDLKTFTQRSKESAADLFPGIEKKLTQNDKIGINLPDYKANIEAKLKALPKPKTDETLVFHTGQGNWIDTDIYEAVRRGTNPKTEVTIVKTSRLSSTGDPAKDAVGIRKLDEPLPQGRKPDGRFDFGSQRGFFKNPFAKSPTPPEPSLPPRPKPGLGSSADDITKERGFITSVKETDPDLAKRVAGQYVPRSTDLLSTKAANLIKDNIDEAESLARTGSSDKSVATAAELIKKYTADARAATDTATANVFFDKAADIANVVAKTLTEQGRAVQAASILGRLTPEGVIRFAAREIQKYNEGIDAAKNTLGGLNPKAMKSKVPELTGEQVADFSKQAKSIEEMPDGVGKAMAWDKLNEQIAALVPSPLYKKVIAVWKAGLLTGIKTSGLNIASNLAHGVSEMVKDIPAAAVDSVASLFSGKRTLALTTGGKGTGGGVVEGFSKGWRYLRTGFDERDIGSKLDYAKVHFGKGKVAQAIQAYEETIFKILGAEDQPFYYGAKARSLYSQSIAEAKNKGLRGAERKAFVEDAVQNPTDDMLRYATYDAETAVFQNKTALGTAAKALQKIPGGELVVPFSKTPSSVAMQVINYSPLGIVKTLAENIGKGRFDQRLFSQGAGRNIVGTGIMYLGYKMFDNDMISLGRPTTEREQKQWEVEGRSPNSILVDGKWRGANTLGPGGFTLILGGYLSQGVKNTGSVTQGLIQMAAAVPKTLTDQTFLRGLDEFVSAITDPARNGKNYFAGLIGSLVPTLVSDVAGATDTTARRTPGILDRLKSRIPGVRETLQPQINTFGQEKTNDKNILEMMADPSRPSDAVTDDAVITELRRLSDAGFQSTPTQIGDKEGFPKVLTPEQNTELFERSGQLLKTKLDKLVQSPQYAKMDDEQKQDTIGRFSDRVKIIARAEMVVTVTLGMTGEELKSKLSELKAGGLLTKEVFKKYVEIR